MIQDFGDRGGALRTCEAGDKRDPRILDQKSNQQNPKTSKADLIAALKEVFAYCDIAYNGLTDESAAQTVKFFGGDTPKLSILSVLIAHNAEHYGNLVTYLRLKNIVPPSTESANMQQPRR